MTAERMHLVAGDFCDNAAVERIWRDAVTWRGRFDVLVLNAACMVPSNRGNDPGMSHIVDLTFPGGQQNHEKVAYPELKFNDENRHFPPGTGAGQ